MFRLIGDNLFRTCVSQRCAPNACASMSSNGDSLFFVKHMNVEIEREGEGDAIINNGTWTSSETSPGRSLFLSPLPFSLPPDLRVSVEALDWFQAIEAGAAPMATKTVKVSNVSLGASEQDIKEFFSFSGDIEYVEMKSGDEWSQVAFVTFKDSQGAETALLLSGATIVDLSVVIAPAPDYQLPPSALSPPPATDANPTGGAANESAIQKAEDVVSSMLAKGFVLGKDVLGKAKAFDEKHQLTSTATAKVASLDKKIGLSEKVSIGTTAVNEKVKEMDQKFHVSEKTKSALAVAEQKVSTAGSAILKNRYIFQGAAWVTGAFNRVAKAAGEVGSKTKEKVEVDRGVDHSFERVHLSEAPSGENSSKPPPAQGLIL